MRLCVVGTGYVGLVTATGFADAGHEVVGVDIDEGKVRDLNSGGMPIHERELEGLLREGIESGRLRFTTDYTDGVRGAEVVFICVGTPSGDGGRTDLSAVKSSTRSVAESVTGGPLIVIKSTVPVGTNDRLAGDIARLTDEPLELASNPEFLKEGAAVEDFLRPDRVLIGVRSARASALLRDLYEPFVRTGAPIIETDPRSAEMAKYAANGMLAARVSFMNEIARLCDALGADVEAVRRVVGSDKRIGSQFLFPGCGYGGSCFPKDVQSLAAMGREAMGREATGGETKVELPLVAAVERTNDIQCMYLIDIIRRHFDLTGEKLSGKSFGVWGLSFKPRTDDVRDSPALGVVRALLAAGAAVAAFDPAAMERAREVITAEVTENTEGKNSVPPAAGRLRFASDRYDAAEGADALVLVTEWPEFRRPDPRRLAAAMRGRVVFDGRNVLDGAALAREGFTVYGIGRPVVRPES